jgi:transposase
VNEEFVTRRRQFKKAKLRSRVFNPKRSNYSLGWVPFKASALTYRGGQVRLMGQALSLWDSYGLSDYELGSGSLNEDARGRWYLNICVKVKKALRDLSLEQPTALGIDLGLKDFMTPSEGKLLAAEQFYRDLEPRIAAAQRAGPKSREGLSVRQWTCPCCGTVHDRDANAARNIKARGLAWLESQFAMKESSLTEESAGVNEESSPSCLETAAGHGRLEEGILFLIP